MLTDPEISGMKVKTVIRVRGYFVVLYYLWRESLFIGMRLIMVIEVMIIVVIILNYTISIIIFKKNNKLCLKEFSIGYKAECQGSIHACSAM